MKAQPLEQTLLTLGIGWKEPNAAGWVHLPCPFAPWLHRGGADKSAGCAFKIEDEGTSAFNCPACKSHGRIEKLVRDLARLREQDYTTLLTFVVDAEAGAMMLPDYDKMRERIVTPALPEPLVDEFFEGLFEDPFEHVEPANYLTGRRVSPEGATKAKIGWDPDKRRIIFPVRDRDGHLFGFTGRTVIPGWEPKVLDYAGLPKRHMILGEDQWTPGKPVVIVEGLMAFARFLTEGVDNFANVGALLGSEMTDEKADRLRQWGLATFLILDPDDAGDQGTWGKVEQWQDRATGEIMQRRDFGSGAVGKLQDHIPVYVPIYPDGVIDPDDLTGQQVHAMVMNTMTPARVNVTPRIDKQKRA